MNLIDDTTLLKMAEAEILREAKRASARHSIAGVSGWQPCPKPNKMFLTNTLFQTMASNKLQTRKLLQKTEKKHKDPERKLLQKSSKTDMTTNIIYLKPNKNKKKYTCSVNNHKFDSSKIKLKGRHSNNTKKIENFNVKKTKLKKL